MSAPRALAVVTGAASGIGAAVARALSPDFQVVGLDLEAGAPAHPILRVDITDRAAVEDAARDIAQRFGSVRLLVNNAGVLTMNRYLDLTDDDWHRVFEVNSYGVFLLGQVFGRQMVKMGGGRIVNVSSVAGKVPLSDQAHYCSSKAAVIMLTRVMARELAEAGISVFAVCPGAVDTDMFRYCLNWSAQREGRDPGELLEEWLGPGGRLIDPGEVASIVRFLATGPTEAMSGHAISIDGGRAQW